MNCKAEESVIRKDVPSKNEIDTLCHCDVSPGLEHHHRDRLSWKGVANDELRDDTAQFLSEGENQATMVKLT